MPQPQGLRHFFYLISESLNITDCIDRLGYVCDLVTGKTFHNVLIYARLFRHRNECCSGIVRPMSDEVSAATTLLKRPADAALSQGIWAVLAVFLLIYIVKSNERFSARQEEREKQYQELLLALTEKFNVLSVIERDITEVKEYIMADTKEINKKI